MRLAAAIIAVVLFIQSFYMLALSMREGFSSVTLLALGVALLPLLLLLVVYLVLRRRPRGTRILVLCGVLLFAIMETLLPVSPFKTTVTSMLQERAIEAVEIMDLRDEPFLSAKCNPIGVRITFEAVFPRGGRLSVSPTLRAVDERYHHYQVSMGHLSAISVEPEPEQGEAGEYLFKAGARHRFSAGFYPVFLMIAHSGGRRLQKGDLCLWEEGTPTLPLEDLQALLREPIETAYHVEIKVSGNSYFTAPRWLHTGITNGRYSLKTSHDAARAEGAVACPW